MAEKIGRQTYKVNGAGIVGWAAAAGPKEQQGPLGKCFDICFDDVLFGQKTFEQAESRMQKAVLDKALTKAGIPAAGIDLVLAGDLLNQCTGSSFGLKDFGIPFLGMYGACSTSALTLGTAAMLIDGGGAKTAAAVTSSHFCASERQYRFPLEYGSVRTPTAQWTVTGAGAFILGKTGSIRIDKVTFGKIEDFEVKDANNMGAAMAPVSVKLRPYPIRN